MIIPWTKQWFKECNNRYGRVLEGRYRHYCPAIPDPYVRPVPVDETVRLFYIYCRCFHCKCKTRMDARTWPFGQPYWYNENIFTCSKKKWYNFWKHSEDK